MLLRTFLPVSVGAILLSDLVEVRTPLFETLDPVVWSALWALTVAMVTGVVVSYIARKIGSTIDYAQEALKKESSRLETASMAGQVALWEWDIRSGGIEWSGAVDAMLGYEPGGLPRTMKSWEQSIYPDDRDRVIACLTEHLERKAPYDVEYRVIRRDGSSAWWHDVGSAQWDGDGRAYKMAGACADITERKHAEETLKAANSYNRSLIEASLDPLATIDATGKITDVNAATESVTGYGKKELVGTDFSDYFTDPEKAREGYQLVFRKGTVRDYPLEIRHRDGRVTPVLYNASVYRNGAGAVTGVFAAARDITERKHMQELMVQSERMQAVGNLAAGLAHEINNPLGIIVQAVQSIERRVSGELPANRDAARELGVGLDQVRAYLEKRQIPEFIGSIREASDRAVKIIQNMLQFSRRSAEGKKTVAVDLLVERALELAATDYDLKKRYDFRNIKIVRDYEAGLPRVPVVEVEIEQVLLNILKNAAQAMKDNPPQKGPEITLRLRRDGKYAVIGVADNGCGMEENVRNRVFEPFYTTKELGVGTGLGLSVSYAIITMNHKGTISVESSPGKGSCFTIRLPLEEGG
jgi:PAS domain S-box-containing protein